MRIYNNMIYFYLTKKMIIFIQYELEDKIKNQQFALFMDMQVQDAYIIYI